MVRDYLRASFSVCKQGRDILVSQFGIDLLGTSFLQVSGPFLVKTYKWLK
jgi:hypothetical protein